MPYTVAKKGGRWCVVKKATGETVACHDSAAKAKAQIAAIQASEHGKADELELEVRAPGAQVLKLIPRKRGDVVDVKALRGGELVSTRADVLPSSVQPQEDGSLRMRVRIASSYPVRRLGYLEGDVEEFEEVLDFSPGAHRGARLESGRAPLLDSHRDYTLSSVLGVLSNPRTTATPDGGGFLECDALVSGRAELEGVRGDIRAGILSNVSIGYRVFQYRDVTERPPVTPGAPPPATRPLRRLLAIDWETREASLLPVGADPTASVRSSSPQPTHIVLWSSYPQRTMKTKTRAPGRQTEPEEEELELELEETTEVPPPIAARGASPPPSPPAPAPPAPAPPGDPVAEERARQRRIRELVSRHGFPLDGPFVRALLDHGVTVADAGGRILDELATRSEKQPPAAAVLPVGGAEEDKIVRAISDALEMRCRRAQLTSEESKDLRSRLQGNPFVHMRLLRIGEEYLARVHGMHGLAALDPLSLAGLIIDTRRNPATQERGVPAFHVTSDFASVLANIANKTLQRQFDLTPDTYSQWVNMGTLPDFKQGKRVALGDAPKLLRKLEGGEIQMGAVSDKGETIQLLTYARGLTISREALVNDDLSAFSKFPRAFGASAKQLEADLVYLVLTNNAALSDTFLLFDDTNHGNYVTGTGNSLATVGVTALSNVRKRARRQKTIAPGQNAETGHFMIVDLVHLRVPEDLETAAQQLVATIQPNLVTSVNVFQGAFRSVMAEPRLGAVSQIAFYMMADPAAVEGIEVDHLEGEAGPVIESRMSWSAEGVQMKCRLDVGVAAVEYRGLYKNDGTT